MQAKTVVFADVYYPWCNHCSRAMQTFAAAATSGPSSSLLLSNLELSDTNVYEP